MKEAELLEYLKKNDFDKKYQKLVKKLKDKKVIVYGTGLMFQVIKKNYDLGAFNIIGISDMKYPLEEEGLIEEGYKKIPREKIAEYEPDIVLVAAQNYFPIIENFVLQLFKDTKLLFIPFVCADFRELLFKIWG